MELQIEPKIRKKGVVNIMKTNKHKLKKTLKIIHGTFYKRNVYSTKKINSCLSKYQNKKQKIYIKSICLLKSHMGISTERSTGIENYL